MKMEKEILTETNTSVSLNVTANKIDSYRSMEETKNTVRIYSGGKIGVAGSLGELDEAALTRSAEEALAYGIEYPCRLSRNVKAVDAEREIIPQKDFIDVMQRLLHRLAEECPKFSVSNKVQLVKSVSSYKNSMGADLSSAVSALDFSLLFQNKGSGNLFDCYYEGQLKEYDEAAVFGDCKKIYDNFYREADIEEGEYPVFFTVGDFFSIVRREFYATAYASGGSMLSGKLGEKIFSEKLTYCNDRSCETNPTACFFDSEGEIPADNFRQPLIKDGVLTNVITCKGLSEMLKLPEAATAFAEYDGVPNMGFEGSYVKPTADSASRLAPDKAVLVMVQSGGDMTPDGHFATPLQMSFLLEKGEIVGKLPDINISGEFFDILGRDYLGAVEGAFFPSMNNIYMCCKMKVSK
ncbi:MAG: metallopeptidase TldD-related protein [Firmicutes bacterium]|nr:metallopeptidase TldD-related protein [[Eubacterium] siraeum]MCM1487318.1 metallopeptidase TldD-related protein [Bacillota bacterium]